MHHLLHSSSFFFFFFLAVVFSSLEISTPYRIIKDEAKFEACSKEFNCGNVTNIGYPFWGGDRIRDCGRPEFELQCHNSSYTVIEIVSRKFSISGIRQLDQTLTVVDKEIMDDGCLDRISNMAFSDSPFECASNNAKLTYVYNCTRNISSTIPSELRCERNTMPVYNGFYEVEPDDHRDLSCNSTRIDVPILQKYNSDLRHNISAAKEILKKGFDLKYNDVYAGRDCTECIDSAGKCGYRRTSHEFVCFSRPGDNNFRLKWGLSIGLSLPVICLSIFLFLWRRKQKRTTQRLSRNISDPYMNSDPEGGSVCYGVHVFSYKDLEEATNNFDSEKELGDGGFGTVYHGKLKDGRDVAVKRLYEHNYKRVEQFKNEVEILTRLRHKNLVSLYGCTSRRCRELLLVYEYIPNGTVADHLHGDRAQTSPLTWPVRMSIAIETATALAYLHASDIVHRDVKTNNILLDDNFCVKVADFGLSRLFPSDVTHVSTAPQGTPGYVDPEYHQCYQLTSKSDVYSFGVVLVELISSMPAVDITRHRHEINLSNLAISKIKKRAYNELVDLRLGFESNIEAKSMTIAVAELAFQCLQQDKEMRPSMDEVLEELKRIEKGNNESENHEKGFDCVTTSEQPPPSPDCHEVGLLKRMNEQPPSPNTVIENWPSSWSSSTPNISG